MGKMHSAHIEKSERTLRILRVLKAADHPLSGEEISARVQADIGKIPQAVSTTIGEMRSRENIADGYVISYATRWKALGEDCGMRKNGDGSITFVIEQATESWHDGRPRYYLEAAPGWTPQWRIDGRGARIRGQESGVRSQENISFSSAAPASNVCQNPRCGKQLPAGHNGPPFCPGPQDACRKAYFDSLQMSLI